MQSEYSASMPKINAKDIFKYAKPKSKSACWQKKDDVGILFLANGSRLFNVAPEMIDRLDSAADIGEEAVSLIIGKLEQGVPVFVNDTPIQSPPLQAISLAIAQKCNLGCSYCYADQGDFGGAAKNMQLDVALQAIDLLFKQSLPGSNVNIAFLGGEPLLNRSALRAATAYATNLSKATDIKPNFSITTNGTLLTEDDGLFFEEHGFAVTISLDGIGQDNDKHRPSKNGKGSFDMVMKRVLPLLAIQKKMQVSVRATITPGNVRLKETLVHFLESGFHSVGFSPLLHAPNGKDEMHQDDLAIFLDSMIDCGLEFERRLSLGQRFAFSNLTNALKELHLGTHRPYPCGAGAGYLGVSAEGELVSCHRFVGNKEGSMGSLQGGIDRDLQNHWLAERHVHRQSPCSDCWARYLCGGGCHHEVIARGRPACDFIRGWLFYCFQAYSRIITDYPEYLMGKQLNARD